VSYCRKQRASIIEIQPDSKAMLAMAGFGSN
jgi:hypothetical protein